MIAVTLAGPKIVEDDQWAEQWETFKQRHCVVFKDFVDQRVLRCLCMWRAQASEEIRTREGVERNRAVTGERQLPKETAAAGFLFLLLNQPRLHTCLEAPRPRGWGGPEGQQSVIRPGGSLAQCRYSLPYGFPPWCSRRRAFRAGIETRGQLTSRCRMTPCSSDRRDSTISIGVLFDIGYRFQYRQSASTRTREVRNEAF